MLRSLKNIVLVLMMVTISVILASCAKTTPDGPPRQYVDVRKIPNAKPRSLPRSKYGNPHTYVIHGKRYYVLKTARGYNKYGVASWYGTKFHGALTSSREPYNLFAMTAASPVLPIPTFVRVTNLANHRSIIVKVNDRGPFADNRIIDLSYVAAKKLGYERKGTAFVKVQAITFSDPTPKHSVLLAQTHTHKKLSLKKHPVFLQLGAFHQFSQAKSLSNRLKTLIKKPVTIYKTQLNHSPIYRLKIGPLLNTESYHLQYKLKKLGFRNIITVIGHNV